MDLIHDSELLRGKVQMNEADKEREEGKDCKADEEKQLTRTSRS